MEVGILSMIEAGLENGPFLAIPRRTKRTAVEQCVAGGGRVFCSDDQVGVQGIGEAHIHQFLSEYALRTRCGAREQAWRRVKTSVHRLLSSHGWTVRTKERRRERGVWDLCFQLRAPQGHDAYRFQAMTREEREKAVKLAYCRVNGGQRIAEERMKEVVVEEEEVEEEVGVEVERHSVVDLREEEDDDDVVLSEDVAPEDVAPEDVAPEAVPDSDDEAEYEANEDEDWDAPLFPNQHQYKHCSPDLQTGASFIFLAGTSLPAALSRTHSLRSEQLGSQDWV